MSTLMWQNKLVEDMPREELLALVKFLLKDRLEQINVHPVHRPMKMVPAHDHPANWTCNECERVREAAE